MYEICLFYQCVYIAVCYCMILLNVSHTVALTHKSFGPSHDFIDFFLNICIQTQLRHLALDYVIVLYVYVDAKFKCI